MRTISESFVVILIVAVRVRLIAWKVEDVFPYWLLRDGWIHIMHYKWEIPMFYH